MRYGYTWHRGDLAVFMYFGCDDPGNINGYSIIPASPDSYLVFYRDNFMSAQEALAYGLIDEIVAPNDEKLRGLALPPPAAAPQLFGEVPADAESYEFGKIVSDLLERLWLFLVLFCVLGGTNYVVRSFLLTPCVSLCCSVV